MAATMAVVAVALALRLYGLDRKSVWFDEAVSVGFAALPIPNLLEATSNDVNPPLYYALLHMWLPLASNDLLLRLPSAIFSSAAVALTIGFGRAVFNTRVGILGGLFTALCAWHIDLGQEARAYGLLTCLATGSLWLLWRAQQQPSWPRWLAFSIVTALTLYAHNYAAFFVFGELVYLLAAQAMTRRALVAFVVVALLVAPWLPFATTQLNAVRGDYWIQAPSPTVLADTYFDAIAYTPPAHGWGMSVLDKAVRWGIAVLLVLSLVSTVRDRRLLLPVLAVATPLALALAISLLVTPIYVVRYVSFVLPAFWLVVAHGIDALRVPVAVAGVVAAIVVELGINLPPLYADPFYSRADLRAAVAIVVANAQPHETVVHSSAFTQYPFAYYDRGRLDEIVSSDDDAALPTGGFWYVRDYSLQDVDGSLAADQQARLELSQRTIRRHFEVPGVHLYQLAQAAL